MDFSKISSSLAARALASSILVAHIISLTNKSTHSAPSTRRLFGVDKLSGAIPFSSFINLTANYATVRFFPIRDTAPTKACKLKSNNLENEVPTENDILELES
jgi:hypothetical protein